MEGRAWLTLTRSSSLLELCRRGWASTSPCQPCSLRKRGQRGRMRTPAVSPSFSTPHPDLHSSSGSLPLNLMTMLRSYPPTQPSPSAVWVHQGRVPQLVQQGAVPGFPRGPRGGDQGVGLPVSILRLSQIHLALACVLCCPWASTRAAWGRGGGCGPVLMVQVPLPPGCPGGLPRASGLSRLPPFLCQKPRSNAAQSDTNPPSNPYP